MIIPPNNQWKAVEKGTLSGSLWSSFNLDPSTNKGKTRVSPRTIITTNDITDLGVPVAFQTFTDTNGGKQYSWCVAGTYVFRNELTGGYETAFAKDAATGTPSGGANTSCSSDLSDLVAFGKSYMVLTLKTRVYFFNASTGQWYNVQYDADASSGGPFTMNLTDNTAHMMCVYGNRVYVTENSTKIWSALSPFLSNTNTNDIWVESGSYTLSLTNQAYPVTSISTIRSASDGIWVFTINQQENGCWAFKWDGQKSTDPNSAYIIPDASGVVACVIKNDVPWIIDNNARLMYFNGGSFVEAPNGRIPVKNTKFLKNALSAVNDRFIHPNGIAVVDGKINVLINNEYEDNGATIEENVPSGLWEYDPEIGWYHKFSLGLYTSSVTDFGQNRVSRVGAIYANKTETTAAAGNGTILMGAQVYTDASSTAENIYINDSNDTVAKAGYFVTSEIWSNQIQDHWQKLFVRFRKLLNSTDKFVVKYRYERPEPTEISITWTSTTTFTYTGDLSAYVGYEVEGLQGKGSGKCAHITAVSYSNPTSTVTIDSAATGASSGTAKVRLQNWKKLGTYNSQTGQWLQFPVNLESPWIQLKVYMEWTGKNEIHDLQLINKTHQKAE